MEITHQADYALRAILYLARLEPGERVPTSLIAAKTRIPPSFLTKIVSQLSIAGLIHTSRGARGGVWLARQPAEITVLEVVEAIEGSLALNKCLDNPEDCPRAEDCVLQVVWQEACAALVSKLGATTFGSLLEKKGETQAA